MSASTNRTGPRRGLRAAAGLAAAAVFASGGPVAADRSGPAVHIDPAALEALGPPRGTPSIALAAPEPAPEPETGPDGLPIYDASQGPPKSRLVGEFATGANSGESVAGPEAAPPPAVPLPRPEAAPEPAAAIAAARSEPRPEPPPVAAPPPEPAPAAPPRALASVAFAPGESDVAPAGREELDRVAAMLAADPALGVQLKAYADAAGISPSGARRLSLLRALSVRAFLMESDIDATRIDVRALGAKYETGPADRVDIVGAR